MIKRDACAADKCPMPPTTLIRLCGPIKDNTASRAWMALALCEYHEERLCDIKEFSLMLEPI